MSASPSFTDNADRLVTFVAEGLPMTEACRRIGVPYSTARKWVGAGRADPHGDYGAFVQALDAARERRRLDREEEDELYEPGPVEAEVQNLIGGRQLDGQAAIAAVQARALARAVDGLSRQTGGSAGLALASVSRRLDDVVAGLRLQPKNKLTELQERYAARRAALLAANELKTPPVAVNGGDPV
jgi:hypothetical protein